MTAGSSPLLWTLRKPEYHHSACRSLTCGDTICTHSEALVLKPSTNAWLELGACANIKMHLPVCAPLFVGRLVRQEPW